MSSDPTFAPDAPRQAAPGPVMAEDVPQLEVAATEAPVAPERDARGVSYVFNLIALYASFATFLLIIAWFGIFSEV